MKITAELKEITQEMTSTQELADALNHNFKELKEASDNKIQVLSNSIGRLEASMTDVKARLGNVESGVQKIIDHLSGKKLLTEND